MLQLREAAEEGTPYQIAILDMHMPGMDGAELGEAVKADAAIADTRLVMMTSLGSRRDAGRFDKIGFTAYLTKPVRLSDLFDSLAAVLSGERPKAGMHLVTRHSIREIRRGNVRILLAEDNIVNQTVALGILKKLGLSADAVASGAEAVKALETIPYNLVLMDVQMPEMDGMEATGRIRDPQSNVLNHDIPIIAMTAHVMQGDREKCLEAGMNDYLSKPVVPQVLAGMLDKWLGAEDDRKEQKEKKGGRISESGSPVFDRKAMLERLMGDESLAKKITTVFLKDIPSQFTDLQNAVNSGNASLAGEIAHKIKGSAGNVGGLSVWDTAYAMEQAGKEKNMIDLLELLPQLEIQLNELKTAMENSF